MFIRETILFLYCAGPEHFTVACNSDCKVMPEIVTLNIAAISHLQTLKKLVLAQLRMVEILLRVPDVLVSEFTRRWDTVNLSG